MPNPLVTAYDPTSRLVTVELTREPSELEVQRIAGAVDAVWHQIEWETNSHAHVCKRKVHGELEHVTGISGQGDGDYWVVMPTCHDCGRALVRPPGISATTLVCPAVHRHPDALSLTDGQALECGEKR